MPKRIQRKRTKGWKMPSGAVYVGRPTKWGNPFEITDPLLPPGLTKREKRQCVVDEYQRYILGNKALLESLAELKGKDLVCWCPLYDKNGLRILCHADILLSLANDIPLEKICAPLTIQNSQKSDVLNAEK